MKKLTFILLFGLITAPIINLNSNPFGSFFDRLWSLSRTTKAVAIGAATVLAVIVYNKLNSNDGKKRKTSNTPVASRPSRAVSEHKILRAPSSSGSLVVAIAKPPAAPSSAVSEVVKPVITKEQRIMKGRMHSSERGVDEHGEKIWILRTSEGDLQVKNINEDSYFSFKYEGYPINMAMNYCAEKGKEPYVEFTSNQNNNKLSVKGTMRFSIDGMRIHANDTKFHWYIMGDDGIIYIPNNYEILADSVVIDRDGHNSLKKDGYRIDLDATFITSLSNGQKIWVQLVGPNRAEQPQASAPVAAAAPKPVGRSARKQRARDAKHRKRS